jgi:peptidyl-prolyl cis-trans isomerase B (cyclophilin B)
VFHRVIPQSMIQGGCPRGRARQLAGASATSSRGSCVTTARALDGERRPEPTGRSFFITEVATPHLDGKHTVFGKVTKGVELIPKIAKAATRRRGSSGRSTAPEPAD